MSRHESGFATMERRSEEIIADNNAVAAIEARAISPEVAVLNDIAELEIYGNRGRTYCDKNGFVIVSPEEPFEGRINAILNDRSRAGTQSERRELAEKYESDLNNLMSTGFELTQAKLIMDLREADLDSGASMVANLLRQGMHYEKAVKQTNVLYAKKDDARIELIRDRGIFSHDEYENLLGISKTDTGTEDDTDAEDTSEPATAEPNIGENLISGSFSSVVDPATTQEQPVTTEPKKEENPNEHIAFSSIVDPATTQEQPIVPVVPPRVYPPRQSAGWDREKRLGARWKKIAIGAAALALAVGALWSHDNDNNDSVLRSLVDRSGLDSAFGDDWKAEKSDKTPHASVEAKTGTEVKAKSEASIEENAKVTGPTEAESAAFYQAAYGNIDTGDNSQHLLGDFEIYPASPEVSVENFYNELRYNPETLAFWQACVATGTPSYESCVGNENVLNLAAAMAEQYRAMAPEEKGRNAEALIRQFQNMKFQGIVTNNGSYRTHGVTEDGLRFYAMNNSRQNDPWLKFSYVDADGKEQVFFVRGCGQIVEDIKPIPTRHTPSKKPSEPTKKFEETGVTSKHDSNEGHNGGTGTGSTPGTSEGEGPSGQTPNNNSFVPGEVVPSSPPEVPTSTDTNSNTGNPTTTPGIEQNPNQHPGGPVEQGNQGNINTGPTNPGNV